MAYELRDFSDTAPATTVASDITSSSTSVTVASGTGYPSGGASGNFMIQIENELIICESRTGDTIAFYGGVSGRGQNGTSNVTHVTGTTVNHVHTALNDSKEANYAVGKTVGQVQAPGDLLVGDGAYSLVRLPAGSDGTLLQVSGGSLAYSTLPSNAILPDTITADMIADGAIDDPAKLGTGVVTADAIATEAVGNSELGLNSVSGAELQNDIVTTSKIVDSTVTAPKLEQSQRHEPGDIKFSARSTPSTGWLLCDGTAVLRADYADLFTAIGTTYGVGDGSTTFNVPDYRGKTILGAGTGSGLTARARGATGGEETHLLIASESGLVAHTHSVTDPQHTHQEVVRLFGGGAGAWPQGVTDAISTVNAGVTGSSATGITIQNVTAASASSAHNNMQPFGVANVFIKT